MNDKIEMKELLKKVDHTNLKTVAEKEDIKKLCAEALEYHMASVCVHSGYVKAAATFLAGKIPVCAVVGFPQGNVLTAAKAYEAKLAVEAGADEIDMVINIAALKNKDYSLVLDDIKAVKAAIGYKLLKVIIECCVLSEEEKIKMCDIVAQSGAEYIKTSTGFSTGGATFEDIALMKKCLSGSGVKIKAAGGIRTVEDMQNFVKLGADRLGTSSAIKIAKEYWER